MSTQHLTLEERDIILRNQSIDLSIIGIAAVTGIHFVLTIFRDWEMIKATTTTTNLISFLIMRGGIAMLLCVLLTLYRHRIPYRWKYLLMAMAGIQVFIFSVYSFGPLAPSKSMLIFSTILIAIGFRFFHAIVTLILLISIYLGAVWAFSTGLLEFQSPQHSGVREFILNPYTWAGQGLMVTGITIALIQMGANQRKALSDGLNELEETNRKLEEEEKELVSLRDQLEQLVEQKTRTLEKTKQELMVANKGLSDRNLAHQLQHSELQQVLEEYHIKQSTLLDSGKLAAVGLLTAGMAHEINNPLNFIQGAAYLLEQEIANTTQAAGYAASISRVRTAVNQTHELVKGLNQFGRKTDRYDEPCDLVRITKTVLSIVHTRSADGSQFETNFDEPSIIMKGNTGKLHQVLLNLFQHALDDMKGQGWMRITAGRSEREINLIIEGHPGNGGTDTTPFIQTGSRKMSLRMYIIHRIIREHGGTLMVTPEADGKKYWKVRFLDQTT